jgi:hypothetical protein
VKRHGLLSFARLAAQIAREQLPDYASKFAPKRYTQPSLLACLCLKEYLHMDYHGAEALLASAQQLQEALGPRTVPDPSTSWWFSRHRLKPRLLACVLTYGRDDLARFSEGLLPSHRRAIDDLVHCRTAALGGHLLPCDHGGQAHDVDHACRHRSCPQCHRQATKTTWTISCAAPRPKR